MRFVWQLKLYQMAKGWRCEICGEGKRAIGEGRTPYESYRHAEMQLVIKPAFFLSPDEALTDETDLGGAK